MQSKTVLIIEDDPLILKELEYFISEEGYTVYTSEDGAEGLRIALDIKPDILLLDIMLPNKDGFEICDILKKGGYTSPIFIITGLADSKLKFRGFTYGADEYIVKPFDIENLLNRIRNAVSR